MNESSQETRSRRPGPRRRTLGKAAWAAPVILIGEPARAMAASPAIVMAHRTSFRWYSNNAPWCTNGDGLSFDTTASGAGVTFTNTRTTTAISGVYALFWFARSNITWTALAGNSGCWSVPTATGVSADGLFQYRTNYTCAITPVNGTTTLSAYAWRSQCFNESDSSWNTARRVRRQAYSTVNGAAQSTDTGVFEITS